MELARDYLQTSVWNQQQLAKSFGRDSASGAFNAWSRDPVNVALYNASIQGRQATLDMFRNELAVTDPNDLPIVIDLLRCLAFEEPAAGS